MNKQETYDYLTSRNIPYEITEHKAVFTMSECADVELPYPEADAKNLFLRDDKKQHYYLVTVRGDKRVDLKALRRSNGTRPLTFASADDLMTIMHLIPGSVTPLGLLNDEDRKIEFFIDEDFNKDRSMIGCHPNDNTATIWMKVSDLVALIEEHGNSVKFMTI